MARNVGLIVSLLFSLLLGACSNSTAYSEHVEEDVPPLEWTFVPYDSDALLVSGRANYEKDDALILSWSASAVTIAFVGTALEAKNWTNGVVYLDIFVDGEDVPSSLIEIKNSDDAPVFIPIVSGLRYGPHVVTLYKRSECNVGDWYLYGMQVLGAVKKELLLELPERKIEFVGNSITCGYDVLVDKVGTEFDALYESSYYGYAGQTAKILDAEAHIICSGGHGVFVNYDGTRAFTLPIVYERTATWSLSALPWDHDKWHPDVVVINLGTNDFASGKNDSTKFVDTAVDFVRKVRTYHPNAKIVILDGPMLTGEYMVKCRQYLDVVKETLEKEGVAGLYRFSFEPRGDSPYGLVPHPLKDEAREDAEKLSAWMRSELGWN